MRAQNQTPRLWTIRDILKWTTDYFKSKGIETARLDAEILLGFSLGVDRLHLYLNLDRPLGPDERAGYRSLVARRGSREPVALITGTKEFWSIDFAVAPGILIPRPETEVLVEAVLNEIKDNPHPRVLEIGTGSGAIAVAVAKDNSPSRVVAVDIDPRALEIARANAGRAEVTDKIDFIASDILSAVRPDPVYDVVCSNPPYIETGVIEELEPEVRDHEPRRALDGGRDGLDVVREISRTAGAFLKSGGALIMEIGEGQEEAVRGIISAIEGYMEFVTIPDLAGIPRVIKVRT
jgi:release factor glutamine methyltransferase